PRRRPGGGGAPRTPRSGARPGGAAPAANLIAVTLPLFGAVISTVALSVITSTKGSFSFTVWPSCTCQRVISPSAIPSPMSGSLNSKAKAVAPVGGRGRSGGYGAARPPSCDPDRVGSELPGGGHVLLPAASVGIVTALAG